MAISLLEYIKVILQKVSFDAQLFEKELKKAIRMLLPEEVGTLQTWCYEQFGGVYRRILRRCFSSVRLNRFKAVLG